MSRSTDARRLRSIIHSVLMVREPGAAEAAECARLALALGIPDPCQAATLGALVAVADAAFEAMDPGDRQAEEAQATADLDAIPAPVAQSRPALIDSLIRAVDAGGRFTDADLAGLLQANGHPAEPGDVARLRSEVKAAILAQAEPSRDPHVEDK